MLFIIYATKLIQTFLFGVVFVVAVVPVVIPCSIKAAFLVGFGSEFLWSQFCEVKTEVNPEVPTKEECIFNWTLSFTLLSSVYIIMFLKRFGKYYHSSLFGIRSS